MVCWFQVEELANLSLNQPVRLFVDNNTDVAYNLRQEFVRIRNNRENDRLAIVTGGCCFCVIEPLVRSKKFALTCSIKEINVEERSYTCSARFNRIRLWWTNCWTWFKLQSVKRVETLYSNTLTCWSQKANAIIEFISFQKHFFMARVNTVTIIAYTCNFCKSKSVLESPWILVLRPTLEPLRPNTPAS